MTGNYYTKEIAEALVALKPGDEAFFWCYEHVAGRIAEPASQDNPHVECKQTVRRVITDGSGTLWIDTTVPMTLNSYQGRYGALVSPTKGPDARDLNVALTWLLEQHRMNLLHGYKEVTP